MIATTNGGLPTSTIEVRRVVYSVPPRLIAQLLAVRIFHDSGCRPVARCHRNALINATCRSMTTSLCSVPRPQAIEVCPWQELEGLTHQSDWLQRVENVLLFGPSGVGKTHLAIGIVLAQIGLDQPCRFYPATALVQELQKARADYNLPAALERLDRYPLLLIDYIG